mmetsp:Transcript_80737/g.216436  ORF Transcript_80737/g.216436 Transcript_80737/m.216436 type:complete len:214 (+) Transcript_80737:2173-2814(+)
MVSNARPKADGAGLNVRIPSDDIEGWTSFENSDGSETSIKKVNFCAASQTSAPGPALIATATRCENGRPSQDTICAGAKKAGARFRDVTCTWKVWLPPVELNPSESIAQTPKEAIPAEPGASCKRKVPSAKIVGSIEKRSGEYEPYPKVSARLWTKKVTFWVLQEYMILSSGTMKRASGQLFADSKGVPADTCIAKPPRNWNPDGPFRKQAAW